MLNSSICRAAFSNIFDWVLIQYTPESQWPASTSVCILVFTLTTNGEYEEIYINQQNGGFAWLIPQSNISIPLK